MVKIESITCHKILNSRGDWTLSTKVTLDDGSFGEQTIPDGASKGENEAVYIPVEKAVVIVSSVINDALKGHNPFDQELIDKTLLDMDGTDNKSHLGGNSILSVSLACAKAAAAYEGIELFQYLSRLYKNEVIAKENLVMPTPVFNILNGGKHASNDLSVQEFMIIPALNMSYDKALQAGVDVYHTLEKNLEELGLDTDVGDEGGFAPNGLTIPKALDLIKKAASDKYKVGKEIFFGMDIAAESFYDRETKRYIISEESKDFSGETFSDYIKNLVSDFELIYIEDPFYEKDFNSWYHFNQDMKTKLLVVGDDLVVTNPKYLGVAIEKDLANSVIVKPNQVGSLTETFEFIRMAQKHKMSLCISHRSGDTAEDSFIADLAIAVGAEFMKSGAPVRGERVVKYNRLLEIFNLFNL